MGDFSPTRSPSATPPAHTHSKQHLGVESDPPLDRPSQHGSHELEGCRVRKSGADVEGVALAGGGGRFE